MDMTLIIVAAILYLVGFPIVFWGLGYADKRFKRWKLNRAYMQKGANKNLVAKNAPDPVWPKWRERLKFTRKDKRQFILGKTKEGQEPKTLPVTRRLFFWLVRLAGLLVILIGAITGNPNIFTTTVFLSLAIFFAGIIYGYRSADKLMKIREAIYKRMFTVAASKLGQSREFENDPLSVLTVHEWVDYIKPDKVEFKIPDSFGEEGAEGFMKHFNQLFGKETSWVPHDDEETGEPGWNFDKGIVTIHAVPPLPRRANWSEHYVLGDGVAWSFFPIALGVEHGLELPNPETGLTEHVLGFDLSGEEAKVAEQFGLKLSQSITTSPMVLVGGSTGGGKALAADTPIRVFKKPNADSQAKIND